MSREFVENNAGVHLMMGEYTLCGDASDAPESEPDWVEGPFQPTDRQTVSCPRCVEIVMACRGLRVKKNAKDMKLWSYLIESAEKDFCKPP